MPTSTQWSTGNSVPVGWMRQFRYMSGLFDRITRVEGAVVECGLGEGHTFAMLAFLLGEERGVQSRTLWGFDSFEGWPAPQPCDASPRDPKEGEWKVDQEMIRRRLHETGIYKTYPDIRIEVVKGFLRDSLPHHVNEVGTIAYLHLDLDLYEGYRDALVHLYDKVADGGVVCFDEYREFPPDDPKYIVDGKPVEKWPGCTKAVDEFFASRPEQLQFDGATKKYFVVKDG